MGYEGTKVSTQKSQQQIRALVFKHKGKAVGFFSEPPMEGFSAQVLIEEKLYTIRLNATLNAKRNKDQEELRIWRVLYHHLKTIFEAAESGVMEFREMILPYVVTKSGKTVAECILPQLDAAVEGNPARLLSGGR
jgi:hypothetical protein